MIINGGSLILNEGCTICENTLVFCENMVDIGKRCDISFNSIITDTNNHYIINKKNGFTTVPLKWTNRSLK